MDDQFQEDWLDTRLREEAPYIDDGGFTARVIQQLPARALRNISRCLGADGALYLGVNSSAHFSAKGRPALLALGLGVKKLPPERELRHVLRLCDALAVEADGQKAKLPLNYLAGDLFGPLIHNLSLSRWVRLAQHAGLVFAGHYYAFKKLRGAINEGLLDVLRPRSRAEEHRHPPPHRIRSKHDKSRQRPSVQLLFCR